MSIISPLKYKIGITLIMLIGILFFNSCERGCKDKKACNYDSKAKLKGTCKYAPDNIKTITFDAVSDNPTATGYSGLDLSTGAVVTSSAAISGVLYFYYNHTFSNGSLNPALYFVGGGSLSDFGNVVGLCEVNDKSTTSNEQRASLENGYMVYLNAVNMHARIYVEEMDAHKIKIIYEYPF